MNIQTISTKELRENFARVISSIEAGQNLLLIYRSKPLAEIRPLARTVRPRSFSHQQLRKWIKSDQLTQKQQKQIDDIIERLS